MSIISTGVLLIVQLVILLAILITPLFYRRFFGDYLSEKGKNLATREDIGQITKIVEGIRATTSAQGERLKAALSKDVHAHQVRYESELAFYREVWGRVIDLENAAHHFPTIAPVDKLQQHQMYERALQAFVITVQKNEPFYPDEIREELILLMNRIQAAWAEFSRGELRFPERLKEIMETRARLTESSIRVSTAIRDRLALVDTNNSEPRIAAKPD